MQEEIKAHKIVFSLVAMWLVIFLVILFLLDAHRYRDRLEAEAVLVLSIVVTSALGYLGLAEIIVGLQFGKSHKRELVTYLVLGMLSLVSGIVLALTTPIRLALISLAVAPHAILFGLFQLRLSRALSHHAAQSQSLRVCGLAEILSGLLLACGFFLSDTNVVSLLGATAAATLLQLAPFLFFSKRNQ